MSLPRRVTTGVASVHQFSNETDHPRHLRPRPFEFFRPVNQPLEWPLPAASGQQWPPTGHFHKVGSRIAFKRGPHTVSPFLMNRPFNGFKYRSNLVSALSLSPALDDDGDTPSAAADGTCQHPSIVLLGSDLPSRSFSRRKGQRAPFNSFGNFHFFLKKDRRLL